MGRTGAESSRTRRSAKKARAVLRLFPPITHFGSNNQKSSTLDDTLTCQPGHNNLHCLQRRGWTRLRFHLVAHRTAGWSLILVDRVCKIYAVLCTECRRHILGPQLMPRILPRQSSLSQLKGLAGELSTRMYLRFMVRIPIGTRGRPSCI
jgi:hypothetical protein